MNLHTLMADNYYTGNDISASWDYHLIDAYTPDLIVITRIFRDAKASRCFMPLYADDIWLAGLTVIVFIYEVLLCFAIHSNRVSTHFYGVTDNDLTGDYKVVTLERWLILSNIIMLRYISCILRASGFTGWRHARWARKCPALAKYYMRFDCRLQHMPRL